MRVTQSMLSNTMLRNLNSSYNRMATLQEQISTGSKLLRPSDDPVGATKAMSYRTQLTQNEQYDTNLDTAAKWLDTTDTALGTLGSAMTRVQELITQAANDTNQTEDRQKMLTEIKQLREEVKDIANTKVGDTYIFSGTRTNEPAYIDASVTTTNYTTTSGEVIGSVEAYTQNDGTDVKVYRDGAGLLKGVVKNDPTATPQLTVTDSNGKPVTSTITVGSGTEQIIINPDGTTTLPTTSTPPTTEDKKVQQYLSGMNNGVNVEIYNGIQMAVNTTDVKFMFDKLDGVFNQIEAALTGDGTGSTSGSEIGSLLGGTNSAADKSYDTIQGVIDLILRNRSDVGAKENRVDTMADRLALQKETLTKQQSNVEDVEYEEAITNLITQESIHNAALSVGGKIIQQTLVNFL